MSNFGRTEKVIFAIAMIALVVFSYFLYDDSLLFPKQNNSQMENIGSVSLSSNDVRRKNLDTFSWIPASKKDDVYQNDSIFTGDRSEASIQLKDGTTIQIQPNSLITLNLKDGQMNLDLRYGALVSEIATGSSLNIKSGPEEYKLENDPTTQQKSKVQFNKGHSGAVGLKLISGKAALIDKKKQAKQPLAQNAPIAVSPQGEVKPADKVELTVLSENDRNFLRINPDDPLPFEWKGQGPISRYDLELSTQADFGTIQLTKQLTESKLALRDPLNPGLYYWKVKAYDGSNKVVAETTPYRITVAHLQAPKILTPLAQADFTWEIAIKKPEDLVASTQVSWLATPSLVNFSWQLSSDAEFKKILKEEVTPRKEAVTPKLGNGTYWVRVRGVTANQNPSPWSEAVSFSMNLVAKKEERPTRPELVTKTISFKPPLEKDRNPAATPPAPKIEWKPVANTKTYHLQISKDMSFKEAYRVDAKGPIGEWPQYKPGKYYFRVYARGVNDILSMPSDVGTLDILSNNPVLSPFVSINVIAATPTPKEVPISWTEIPFAKSYLVQMDSSKDFRAPTTLEYPSARGTLKVSAPGKYNIRVQALDESNKPLTEFSNIEELLYSFRSPLSTPVLSEPFNNASIFLQQEIEPFIWLEWKKVEGATQYKIEVSNSPDFSNPLITKTLSENRFLIKDRIPLGKIYWRVRAESAKDSEISDWTAKREFTIYHQKNETFAQ